jgi:hypothetical protein
VDVGQVASVPGDCRHGEVSLERSTCTDDDAGSHGVNV